MKGLISCAGLVVVICGLWVFPRFWYNHQQTGGAWLSPKEKLVGWDYKVVPVDKAAERSLVADELLSGELSRSNGPMVSVFSAKRYSEKQNEIGLFVHTPDRCWTENGWHIEPVSPDLVEVSVHGMPVKFERRIFEAKGARELVYFGGLVGGKPLPYRLDHNLSVGMKVALQRAGVTSATKMRATDNLLWRRVWESFTSRKPLLGPKQFLRISTQIRGNEVLSADALLRIALDEWLQAADYRQELQNWEARPRREQAAPRAAAHEGGKER